MNCSVYKYNCEKCAFFTNYKNTYDNHVLSERHKIKSSDDTSLYSHICNKCNKSYKTTSGLWKHRSKCTASEPAAINIQEQNTFMLEKISEFKTEIKTDIKTIVEDLKANQKPTIINNNINIILTENFKPDKDFFEIIKGIDFSESYPSTISSDKYVNAVSEAVKKEINKLPIDERPIFCIKNEVEDQNIIHVRSDNTWVKETELEWTSQIHNSYFTEYDESQKKIIFKALEHLEQKLKNRIRSVHGQAAENEYGAEMSHPPNKIQIIKYVMEYVNIDRDELMKIINETYNELQHKT